MSGDAHASPPAEPRCYEDNPVVCFLLWYSPLKEIPVPPLWLWLSILLIALMQSNQLNNWDLLKEGDVLEKPGPST